MFSYSGVLALTAAVLSALSGLFFIVGGVWLIVVGGSWYYVIAGVVLLLTTFLLLRRRAEALWLYAAIVIGTLVWSIWEAGIDWWPLSARGDVIFVIGLLFLLLPAHRAFHSARRSVTAGRVGLAVSLLGAFAIAAASWATDPHTQAGSLPDRRAAATASDVPAGEWPAYGRTNAGQRYSPLTQITPQNVANLEVAWKFNTGDLRGQPGDPQETTFEVTPLKIGERLYICTPHQDVIALDATTGEQIWRYDPKIRDRLALQHLTCRGLSYSPGGGGAPAGSVGAAPAPRPNPVPDLPVAAEGGPTTTCTAKLFMPTADGRVIALDPDSGAVCANFGGGTGQINLWSGMPNVKPGAYYSTSPVVVTRDFIIVGGTVLDNVSSREQSGVVRGYDIATGALVWNWDPAKPEETEPIPPDATYTPNSPNAWSILSADEGLGLVYLPMGNQPPDQWGAERSEAVERYSSAVVALEIATGRVRWSYRTVHHDLWDYDVPSQPTLIDLTVNGNTVPALVQPTKQGEIFVLDRRDGKPILPAREVPAPQGAVSGDWTAATQPKSELSFDPAPLRERDMWGVTPFDQLVCRIMFRRLRYEGRYTPPSLQGTLVYPGNFGVFNWGGIAVDPERQVAFTTPAYLAFVSQLVPRQDDKTLYVQGSERPQGSLPALNENFGTPYAVKLSAFVSPLGIPCQEPPWGYVAGADLTTGKIEWRHKNGTVRDLSPVPLPLTMGVPSLGGPMITGGGVAFLSGTLDYFLRAYDLTTGRQLWQSRLPAGGQATPMSYQGRDGRQYVVVAAGGHGSLGTKAGDALIAYALPR
ncbi:membrane-bound PQQ-dependent dehydrogenase, glucose/quinate/shikimate family [Xanthobacteraceae bacterium Astr-EGSB]|uniref:membrane-bound PQQ-dependent dehydrogenase, glucose/quinate/shikimate family n=1 Tax=Astrobacterium formosum TaxID=3069710 RepID=UPI0027B69719|nr:membrane-bound PQQ-dependent dehydrogenase, glucose/quinate/shikimate family [Xanthobacteraceae bacterium Astr-EGSB]